MNVTSEIAVVGGGPSGLAAALAIASTGAETMLFAPPPERSDRRTTALLDGSVRVLEALGVWPALAPHAAPLQRLRLVDATRRLFRAPEVLFEAAELGLDAFGQNVENEILRSVLREVSAGISNLHVVETAVDEVRLKDDAVALSAGDTRANARLLVAADGRNSVCRKAAGISMTRRDFAQAALTTNLRHSRRHHNISTEFHTESGPFTLVPLPGERSSLVWVMEPDEAEGLSALDDGELGREVERRAQSILGRMEVDGRRGSFPIAIELADRFAGGRIALIGEAGHVLPPIGAQGLNLGIRDAATIAELVADARRQRRDPGDNDVTGEYDVRRQSDVRSRALAVELMSRSLLTGFLPVHALRGAGLDLAARFGVVRRALMREGLGPRDEDAPRLARGEAL